MDSPQNRPFPVIPLVAASLMIFDSIVGIRIYQSNHPPQSIVEAETAIPVKSRDLRFVDAGDGAAIFGGHVSVYDATTGARLPPLRENEGFVRTVLNSLAFERNKRSIDTTPVFRLTYWSSKRMTFEDRQTGKRVILGEFGAKNEGVFMRFLTDPETGS